MQRLACEIVKLDRCDTSALEHDAKILQGRDQISHRLYGVGLKITAPDDAFFSDEVDQDQRPVGDGGDPCDNRTPELEYDCSRPDGFECERGKLHCKRLPIWAGDLYGVTRSAFSWFESYQAASASL